MSIHLQDLEGVVFSLLHWRHRRAGPNLNQEEKMLVEAYRSGQITEAAWEEHLDQNTYLAAYWRGWHS